MTRRIDLYAVLGVSRQADAAAIRKAWKAALKRCHPDVGGDRREFDMVQTAMAVLTDPKRRSHYDQTGEFDAGQPPDNELADVLMLLAEAIEAIVDDKDISIGQLVSVDMIAGLHHMMESGRKQGNAALLAVHQEEARWLAVKGRFSGESGSFAEDVIATRLRQIHERQAKISARIRSFEKADEFLSGMKFRTDWAAFSQGTSGLGGIANLFAT